ncbi:MAG: TetR family transcriptional regulator [Ilumatobacteraceae bacterium]
MAPEPVGSFDTSTMPTPPSGARERRRQDTQRKLREAALRLFSARGYDETSVDEIAALSGVSRRTFFRYFDSKEDLLFSGDPGFTLIVPRAEFDRATAHVDLGAVDLSDLGALNALLAAYVPVLEARRERLIAFRAAIASSAALRGRTMDSYAFVERWIQETLGSARQMSPETGAVLGTVGAAVLNLATSQWVADPRVPLAGRVEEAIEVIRRAGDHPAARGADGRPPSTGR